MATASETAPKADVTGPFLPDRTVPLALPAWVSPLVEHGRPSACTVDGMTLHTLDAGDVALLTLRVPDAIHLHALALQRRTIEAYRVISEALRGGAGLAEPKRAHHPIRFWNFIPDIGARVGDGLDRYMAFNAGRFAAYMEWFEDVADFDHRVPTATGIGHDGQDLDVHVLAAAKPGMNLQNPRQRQPRCYSRCYGPFPPCFARATVIEQSTGTLVLIGGTAAVCGEHSRHRGDVVAQTEETLTNLSEVVRFARDRLGSNATRDWRASQSPLWSCFQSLRVYLVNPDHTTAVRTAIADRFSHLRQIEFVRADICRRELLVEIEGTATLVAQSGTQH